MKTIIKTVLFLFIVSFISCQDDNESISIDESNKLIGYWINPVSNNSELKLERTNSFKKDEYGISFLA